MLLMTLYSNEGLCFPATQMGAAPPRDLRGLLVEASKRGLLPETSTPALDDFFQSENLPELMRFLEASYQSAPPLETDFSGVGVPLVSGDLICVGRNYAAHARELGNPLPDSPVLFTKPRTALLPSGGTIIIPGDALRVEFEGELALIPGDDLVGDVDLETARQAVFAVTLLNDITDRGRQAELKKEGKPWLIAKGRPTYAPLGPALYVLQSYDELLSLEIQTFHNGVLKQEGRVRDWIWPPAELLQAVARTTGIRAGDILATGTPAGVAQLKNGDRIVVSCPVIGRLENTVIHLSG